MMQDNVKEAVTFRNSSDQMALPIRRWESFLPGTGLGGSFVHWNGQSFRFQAPDFIYRTHILPRYGKKFLEACGPELTIEDWGVSYDELEPFYDRFEYLCGVSGKAGNINGQIQPGGNPFEAPRSREYPTPPMKEPYFGALFRKGAESLGYHPYPQPSSNLSECYTNPEGIKLSSAPSAGSASAMLASTSRRQVRKQSSCRFCSIDQTMSCERTARSCASIWTQPAIRQPASATWMQGVSSTSNPPTSS
jgi:gluconate 2-dehydrogenase alpha chain